jgi:hypothetical protein
LNAGAELHAPDRDYCDRSQREDKLMSLVAAFPQADSADYGPPKLEYTVVDLSTRNELLLVQKLGIEQ